MATMIPSDIQYFKTEGEKMFYHFLKNVAKPDSKFISWYLPDINDSEPDFLLFADDTGLIIFEVKDWNLNQIKEADPHYFILDIGGRTESRTNPYRQARMYFDIIMEKLKEDDFLLSKYPEYLGKPKIPVSYGVVFPNINKYEYMEKGLDKIISTDRIFFWDDIHPQSDISTGGNFSDTLKKMFRPKFPFTATQKDIDHLRRLFFPCIVIPDSRITSKGYISQAERLKILDHNQEAIARKFDSGHRIIVGPSGSGKTIILACKATFLRQYNPDIKKILFVCYNITLVNYIKRLLSERKVPLGPDGVEVYHFFELCSKILNMEIYYEKEDESYYETVIDLTLSKLNETDIKYDAVLVDEGQDFTDEMYDIVLGLLNKKTDNLTIAIDDRQNIYQRKKSWNELGIKARGRIQRLKYIYRNTKEIIEFAHRITGDTPAHEQSKQQELFPDFFDYHGPQPQIKKFEDFNAFARFLSEEIRILAEKEGYPFSDIAILYPVKSLKDRKDIHIPEILTSALLSKSIISNWSSEDSRSKRSYDITTNSVTISTIHSAKGLDYACVFLVGLESLSPGEIWTEKQIESLLYVAVTRARYKLYIPYTETTPLIQRLLSNL